MSGEQGLQWAVQNGDIDSVRHHVEKGVNVNETVKNRTPLHFAADYGQDDVLKLLLENGAEVNATDKYGITPLLAAIYEGHVKCVNLLLQWGASQEGTTPDGQSYYDVAPDSIKAILKGGQTVKGGS